MTTTRREFIVGTGAAMAVSHLPVRAAGADGSAAAEALPGQEAEELLADYPESAASLGIVNGERAALKAKLADRSAAGQEMVARRIAHRLERLNAIDTSGL